MIASDELSVRLGEYILTGGVYGAFDNKISARQGKQKSKLGYFVKRAFMPYRELKFRYPICKNVPFCIHFV